MGHRKNSGRNSVYTQGRRGMSIGIAGSPPSPPHRPLSHSSPVRQSNRPPRRVLWGNGSSRNNYNASEDRPTPCVPNEAYTWSENFGNVSKSPNSVSIGSDGGRSISSDGGSNLNSTNSGSSKYSNSGSSKKVLARPSNPLRYKTELCRSFEESGDCRFGAACTFAHGLRELRAVLRHPRYKTDLCRTYHGAGYCQYGARCHFVHDPEEAAGVSAMRGYKLRSQPDRVNTTMLTMSGNCDVASRLNTNGLILANLQRLHAYKTAEENFRFLNSSVYGTDQLNCNGTLTPEPHYLSLDMLTIGQDSLSGVTSVLQPQENFGGTSDNHPESISVTCMDMNTPGCGGSNVVRSTASLSGSWWDTDPELRYQCSFPDFDALPPSSRADTWRLGEVSTPTKAVIGNPMEVSRSLLIPSITELMHMP